MKLATDTPQSMLRELADALDAGKIQCAEMNLRRSPNRFNVQFEFEGILPRMMQDKNSL